jgi:hypothetical protein
MTCDLAAIWEDQYRPNKDHPRGIPAAEFFGMNAMQLFRVLFREKRDPSKPPPETDNIAFLKRINQHRAEQGLPPATPEWFAKRFNDAHRR